MLLSAASCLLYLVLASVHMRELDLICGFLCKFKHLLLDVQPP